MHVLRSGAVVLGAFLLAASSPAQNDFRVVDVNLLSGPAQAWPLNGSIDIRFSEDVDLTSVSPTTVAIEAVSTPFSLPAVGTFSLPEPDLLRFAPRCPTEPFLTDGGLRPGVTYELFLPGRTGHPTTPTIQSTGGAPLARPVRLQFEVAPVVLDPLPTPPALVVRDAGTSDPTSWVELGGDPNRRYALERDPSTGVVSLERGARLPLNLYTATETQVAFLARFDQPLLPGPTLAENLGLVWTPPGGAATRFPAGVEPIDLCGMPGEGALVQVSPEGILPQGERIELWIGAGLSDLAGQAVGGTGGSTGVGSRVGVMTDPGTRVPGDGADALLETFDDTATRDDDAPVVGRPAEWGPDGLAAPAGFPGGGGPGGNFDWVVRTGQTVILDTASDQIVGGPQGVPITTQSVVGGVVVARDVVVDVGGVLIVRGPNPLTVFASGTVRIDGRILADGGDSPGVGTLNTTNQPEVGANGGPGGGRGGTGSASTSQSTARGGTGAGPFDFPGGGGEGGESSYSTQGKDRRRGAGGGGGRFASDVYYDWNGAPARCQTLIGLDAEPGFPGGFGGLGAISQTMRAAGGAMGPLAFEDASSDNDFLGTLEGPGGQVLGELVRERGGTGGGGGGDAIHSPTFPLAPFNPAGDEKGSGGGGGGGSVTIVAQGPLIVGATGTISADGGTGGGGENVIFFDRVGGGSGGGSGGLIVLESHTRVEVQASAPVGTNSGEAQAFYTDSPTAAVHPRRPISAVGGQGGAGQEDRCGANANGMTLWRNDGIPLAAFEGRTDVPPLGSTPGNIGFDFCNLGSPNDPVGTAPGAGGDGGPGLVQVHVNDASSDILLPAGNGVDATFSFAPPPVGWTPQGFTSTLQPRFGAVSSTTTKWIALGAAGWDPTSGASSSVAPTAPGFDAQGSATTTGGLVDPAAALVGPTALVQAPGLPSISPSNPFILRMDGLGATDDVYLRNPRLLRGGSVRLESGPQFADFAIAEARYDVRARILMVLVDASGPPLTSFAGAASASILPRSLNVAVGGVAQALPAGYDVRLRFDAARADAEGRPDPASAFSAAGSFATDLSQLANPALGDWDFFRFRVELERPASADTTPFIVQRVQLPFRF